MGLPDSSYANSASSVLESDATLLFIERAQAVQQEFRATDENAKAITLVCRRLDGLALAIELAAARLNFLSVQELADRLDDRFRLLTGGNRIALQRHQTLLAAIDWSYELLDPEEKSVLRRLAVFAGGWTLDAAEFVVASQELDPIGDVVQVLSHLVDKSLVSTERVSAVVTRYRLLESLRQYAHNRLVEARELDETARSHADFYLGFAQGAYQGMRGPHQHLWAARIDDELDNLRACFEWTVRENPTSAIQLLVALEAYWTVSSDLTERREWITRALAAVPGQNELRAHALLLASRWAYFAGDYGAARRHCDECLALSKRLDSNLLTGQALLASALLELIQGSDSRPARLVPLCNEAERCLRDARDPTVLARSLSNMAHVLRVAGESTRSMEIQTEAVGLARSLGDSWLTISTLIALADVEFERGDHAAAEEHWKEALLSNPMRESVMGISIGLARLAAVNGSWQRCVRLLAAAGEVQAQLGWRLESAGYNADSISAIWQAAERALGQENARNAWREGAQMTVGQLVRYGLADELPSTTSYLC
jgi:non-specific serine/threonine protein kinase